MKAGIGNDGVHILKRLCGVMEQNLRVCKRVRLHKHIGYETRYAYGSMGEARKLFSLYPILRVI